MNLLPSADQTQIIDAVRSFLNEQSSISRFRPPSPQIGNHDARLWPKLGELGFLGISVAEAQGGIGLGAIEDMLAYREFGRELLSPAVFGLTLGAELAAAKGASDVLAQFLAGAASIGLANPRRPAHMGAACSGEFHLIDADQAEWIFCCTEQGVALFRTAQFDGLEPVLGTDNVLHLQRASLKNVKPALWLDAASSSIYLKSLLLTAAYAVGMAEATRDMAVEYAKMREQFGKPIGSFQAVKHICADMAIRAEAALCQTSFASLVIAEKKPGAEFHATSAKIVATKAALENGAQNIQVHGAFGFTSEADAHLYLKRAHVMDQLGGDLRRQRERLIDLPFPEAA